MTFRVDWDEDAGEELMRLPAAERRAVMSAVAKLEAFGGQLGSPHTSQVKGSRPGIRELRPRARPVAVAGAVSASCRRDGDTGGRAGS